MLYSISVAELIPAPKNRVFAALTKLEEHPLWNDGLLSMSHKGPMREGMVYETVSVVVGQKNHAKITVERLVPDQEIILVNHAGAISYRVRYQLIAKGSARTELFCQVDFELKSLVLQMGHGMIESMARNRISGDLQNLKTLLSGTKQMAR